LIEGQVEGSALAMTADAFRASAADSPELRAVINRYAQAHLNQVAQSAACNAVHTIEQRLVRWLLLTDDRTDHAQFRLTQDLLARMLGTRRETVSVAAGRLKSGGLIQYARGRVTVADLSRLEAAACECYRQTAERYRVLLGQPDP
jgi:CRP-like cAMP-binding protein